MTLAEEVDLLREENRQLKAALGRLPEERALIKLRTRLRVSPNEARLLLLHYRHDVVSRDNCMDALYGDSDDAPYQKIIDVMICKLRRHLKATRGVNPFETLHGGGRRLTWPGRALLAEALDDAPPPAHPDMLP